MVTDSILRHLLCDDYSLGIYQTGKLVSFNEVKRALLLKERAANRNIPDQYYRLLAKNSFLNISSIADCLNIGLSNIANDYLTVKAGTKKIFVKESRQNDWQELITYIPPLVLIALFLEENFKVKKIDIASLNMYYNDFILPNVKYTALVPANNEKLDSFLNSCGGLYDLHMHLNGATETDNAWQDYLNAPNKVYQEFKIVFGNEKVKEQLEQESPSLTPLKFHELLLTARRLRTVLFELVFSINLKKYKHFAKQSLLLQEILNLNSTQLIKANYRNDFLSLIMPSNNPIALSAETLMYILVLKNLKKNKGSVIGPIFHFYLLILGLCNRLLVQQTHQYGFEQFQKHTLNGLREYSEKNYKNRFFQMQGNEGNYIMFLEGRLSPKEKRDELLLMISLIESGWKALPKIAGRSSPVLSLTAHFIKRADTSNNLYIRHKDLRKSIWKRALVLAYLKKRAFNKIVAIDAAASEFDAPPEVFAPAFRMLYRAGFKNFTYHAGEDFYHLAGGLRAIYEAIVFNEFKPGCRIGHATATAISVKQWIASIGKIISIQRGEILDNLVFIYHFISEHASDIITPAKLEQLRKKIERLAKGIYGKKVSNSILKEAWLLRRFCPILGMYDTEREAKISLLYDPYEWAEQHQLRTNKAAREIYNNYHSIKIRKKYSEIINVKTLDGLTISLIESIQIKMLEFMYAQGIVIETLPTSNVRISVHRNYSTYHLKNWLLLQRKGLQIPKIVVGTDDTGIFATNIYNEYANIYCYLEGSKEIPNKDIMSELEMFHQNANSFKFV